MPGEHCPAGEEMSQKLETRTKSAELIWAGRLDGGQPNALVWTGAITAQPGLSQAHKLGIDSFFVATDPTAHIRCVDGRPQVGLLGDTDQAQTLKSQLGPQLPGGMIAAAWAFRLADFDYGSRQATVIDDLIAAKQQNEAHGLPFPPGAHRDDHAQPPNTGCGAIDNLPAIMNRLTQPAVQPIVKEYTRVILADDFQETAFKNVMAKLKTLNSPKFKSRYLMQNQTGEYEYKALTIGAIAELAGHEAIEKMTGAHKEAALIINTVKDQTFHRDLFCLNQANKLQIFNYDFWSTAERAAVLYRHDPKKRAEFISARVMYAVGAMMVLTDGSIEVAIRK